MVLLCFKITVFFGLRVLGQAPDFLNPDESLRHRGRRVNKQEVILRAASVTLAAVSSTVESLTVKRIGGGGGRWGAEGE